MKIKPCIWYDLDPDEEKTFCIERNLSLDQKNQYPIRSERIRYFLYLTLVIVGLLPLCILIPTMLLASAEVSGAVLIAVGSVALKFAVISGFGIVMICINKPMMKKIHAAQNIRKGKCYLATGKITGKTIEYQDSDCEYYLHINEIPIKCEGVYHRYREEDTITVMIADHSIVGMIEKDYAPSSLSRRKITSIHSAVYRELDDNEIHAFELEDYSAANIPPYPHDELKEESANYKFLLWIILFWSVLIMGNYLILELLGGSRWNFADCLEVIGFSALFMGLFAMPLFSRIMKEIRYTRNIRAGNFQLADGMITDRYLGHHVIKTNTANSRTKIVDDHYVFINDIRIRNEKLYKAHRTGETLLLVICAHAIVGIAEE